GDPDEPRTLPGAARGLFAVDSLLIVAYPQQNQLKFVTVGCKVRDMYCPTCGKRNSAELKFCAACGTNLEAVSQALTGREEDFFTKMDAGIDQFVGRYAEHVFRHAPQLASERKVARSWQLLGQAALTSLLDLLLFVLMWNMLPP